MVKKKKDSVHSVHQPQLNLLEISTKLSVFPEKLVESIMTVKINAMHCYGWARGSLGKEVILLMHYSTIKTSATVKMSLFAM